MGSKSTLRQVPSGAVARECTYNGVQRRARDEPGLPPCGVAQGEKEGGFEEGPVMTGVSSRSKGMILCLVKMYSVLMNSGHELCLYMCVCDCVCVLCVYNLLSPLG